MSRRIESVEIAGPAGRLEGVWTLPARARSAAALVCHPHPQHGGSMHTKAVHATSRALVDAGLPVLRFNFRGVGRSTGRYSGGPGEREDARAALAWLQARDPGRPVLLGGFSFGAWVALAIGEQAAGIAALLAIGPPLGLYDFSFVGPVGPPILCVAGEQDAFCPPAALQRFAAVAPARVQFEILSGGEHLLTTRLPALESVVRRFAGETFSGGAPT